MPNNTTRSPRFFDLPPSLYRIRCQISIDLKIGKKWSLWTSKLASTAYKDGYIRTINLIFSSPSLKFSLRERSLMTSLVFWLFLTHLVLLYNVPFLGYLGPPLPTLIWDFNNERSHITNVPIYLLRFI